MDGPQRIVFVVQVRAEHWTSEGYLHNSLYFVTCDIQLNDIEIIYNCDMLLEKQWK